VTIAEILAFCAGRMAAVDDHPWGDSPTVFKIGDLNGPMFAIVSTEASPPVISLKCDPDLAEALRRAHPAVAPGYHLSKRHWNTVTVDGSITDDELRSMVDHSWEQVVAGMPRARRPAQRV
jgi:predicted DNA-binding protein (MmcQ/YjbR family)